jgi:hypothetical protein
MSIEEQLKSKLTETSVILAKTREGAIYQIVFSEAEDEDGQSSYHTENWSHCWNTNGESVKNPSLDIVEVM